MLDFENPNQVGEEVEREMCPDLVELLCTADKFRVTGRPILEEHWDCLYAMTEAAQEDEVPIEERHDCLDVMVDEIREYEVTIARLYMRAPLGPGYDHHPQIFRGPMPVAVCRTLEGNQVHLGITEALGFSAVALG